MPQAPMKQQIAEAVPAEGTAVLQTCRQAAARANSFLARSQSTLPFHTAACTTFTHSHCTSTQVAWLPSSNKPTCGKSFCWQPANTSHAVGLPTPEQSGMSAGSEGAPTDIHTPFTSSFLRSGIEDSFLLGKCCPVLSTEGRAEGTDQAR